MVDKIKLILGLDATDMEKDELIELYLSFVEDEIIEYCGADTVVPDSLKIKMTVFKVNRQGTEALSGYNYSGVAETFLEGYPQDIINSLNSYRKRKVRFL